MNCEQCNSGDNCERANHIKFREYHDWLIPFKYKICQYSYFLCNICHTKRFQSNKRKYIFIKRRVIRHLLYHSDVIKNKRIWFTELNKVRVKISNFILLYDRVRCFRNLFHYEIKNTFYISNITYGVLFCFVMLYMLIIDDWKR